MTSTWGDFGVHIRCGQAPLFLFFILVLIRVLHGLIVSILGYYKENDKKNKEDYGPPHHQSYSKTTLTIGPTNSNKYTFLRI